MKLICHVYLLGYPDGTPYYVGKGHWRRVKHSRRNVFANNVTRKLATEGYFILPRIVYSGAESKCLALEINLIKHYGRRDNNTGILTNLTDGGEGPSGVTWTPEKLKNLSEGIRRAGIKPNEEAHRLARIARREKWEHRGWMSDEGRLSVSRANTGRIHGEIARENVRRGQIERREKERAEGKTLSFRHSDETRERMSASQLRRSGGYEFIEPTLAEYAKMTRKEKDKVSRERRRRDASPEKKARWAEKQKHYRQIRNQRKSADAVHD